MDKRLGWGGRFDRPFAATAPTAAHRGGLGVGVQQQAEAERTQRTQSPQTSGWNSSPGWVQPPPLQLLGKTGCRTQTDGRSNQPTFFLQGPPLALGFDPEWQDGTPRAQSIEPTIQQHPNCTVGINIVHIPLPSSAGLLVLFSAFWLRTASRGPHHLFSCSAPAPCSVPLPRPSRNRRINIHSCNSSIPPNPNRPPSLHRRRGQGAVV